jgi:Domain of unknown function (DUF4189)
LVKNYSENWRMMHKNNFYLVAALSCLSILGFVQSSNAQSCSPGTTIEKDVLQSEVRTGDGPLFEDGAPVIRKTVFTAPNSYVIVNYNFIEQRRWGKASFRINEFAAGTNTISLSDVQSAKRDLADYIGGQFSIRDIVKVNARQRLEQMSNQYASAASVVSASNAQLELFLEAIPRSQKRTSLIQGFLRVKMKCVGFSNPNELRLALKNEIDRILNQAPPEPSPLPVLYGAFAFSQTVGEYGIAWGNTTAREAETAAMQSCRNLGASDCQILTSFTTSGAIARGDDGRASWAVRGELGEAERAALEACRSHSTQPDTCKIIFRRNADGTEAFG